MGECVAIYTELLAMVVQRAIPGDRLDVLQMIWVHNIVEPASDSGAVDILEDKVVHAVEYRQSLLTDQTVRFKNAGPGSHAGVGITYMGVAVEGMVDGCDVIGSHHVKAPRLPACEAIACGRETRCCDVLALWFRLGIMWPLVTSSAAGTIISFVVGDVLGDWDAHLVDLKANFWGQSHEVERAFARDLLGGRYQLIGLYLTGSESPCYCFCSLDLEHGDLACCDRWDASEALRSRGCTWCLASGGFPRRLNGSSHFE